MRDINAWELPFRIKVYMIIKFVDHHEVDSEGTYLVNKGLPNPFVISWKDCSVYESLEFKLSESSIADIPPDRSQALGPDGTEQMIEYDIYTGINFNTDPVLVERFDMEFVRPGFSVTSTVETCLLSGNEYTYTSNTETCAVFGKAQSEAAGDWIELGEHNVA